MLKKYKDLIISIAFPLIISFIIALITRSGIDNLDNLTKPSFMPPNMLFGIIWTILYILLGVSSYLIKKSYSCYSNTCLLIYYTQLFVNFMWPIIFFSLELRLFAFIWILLLDLLVIYMIWCFYGIKKEAAYILIPYVLWLIFATFLNYNFYILNR